MELREIILSSVVATGRVNADVLIHFNESLKNFRRANVICFVDSDISKGHLYKDRLHLLEAGKRTLANDAIKGINNYFLSKHRQKDHFTPFSKITSKGITTNKQFWKTTKPFLTNKGCLDNKG